MHGLFITGTDTDVGKTIITTGLIKYFRASQFTTCGVKPVCCGGKEDVEAIIAENQNEVPESTINPLYLEQSAAPLSITSAVPPLSEVISPILGLPHDYIITEGAGGWHVPVSADWNMDNLAIKLNFPVIMVIANKLGALNHSVLTANAILSSGLPLIGYFLNTIEETEYPIAQKTNSETLKGLLPCPCLGEIPLNGASLSSIPLQSALKNHALPDLPLHFFPTRN